MRLLGQRPETTQRISNSMSFMFTLVLLIPESHTGDVNEPRWILGLCSNWGTLSIGNTNPSQLTRSKPTWHMPQRVTANKTAICSRGDTLSLSFKAVSYTNVLRKLVQNKNTSAHETCRNTRSTGNCLPAVRSPCNWENVFSVFPMCTEKKKWSWVSQYMIRSVVPRMNLRRN